MGKVLFILDIGLEKNGPSVHLMTDIFAKLCEHDEAVVIHRVKDTFDEELFFKRYDNIPKKRIQFISIYDKRRDCNGFAKKYIFEYIYIRKVSKTVKHLRGIDCIFLQSNNLVYFYAKQLKKLKKPIVYNCQDIFPLNAALIGRIKKGGLVYNYFNKSQIKGYFMCDQIITISNDMKKTLEDLGVPFYKIKVIFNWGTVDKVQNIDCKKNPIVKKLGVDTDKFNIVYAGNIGYVQNVEFILKVAPMFSNFFDFYIIGNGALRDEMMLIARDQKISNIHFHDALSQDESIFVYSMADVNLITLKKGIIYTATPSKTANIVASQKPIITIFDKCSEINDILSSVPGYFSVDNDDYEAFKKIVLELANTPSRVESGELYSKYFSRENAKEYALSIRECFYE